MKVVPDTMIWVSYCSRRDGYRHRLVERARAQRVRFFASSYILDELSRVLTEDLRLSRRYATMARGAVARIVKVVKLPAPSGTYVPGDPNDDPVVLTAITARADYLVTADAAILAVGKYQDIEFITASEFESKLVPVP